MFSKRQIEVFDTRIFKYGSFITFCEMVKENFGMSVKRGKYQNGIIYKVKDDKIKIIKCNGDTLELSIGQVKDPHNTFPIETQKYEILGVKEDVVNL